LDHVDPYHLVSDSAGFSHGESLGSEILAEIVFALEFDLVAARFSVSSPGLSGPRAPDYPALPRHKFLLFPYRGTT
jgi:hypothetical protein